MYEYSRTRSRPPHRPQHIGTDYRLRLVNIIQYIRQAATVQNPHHLAPSWPADQWSVHRPDGAYQCALRKSYKDQLPKVSAWLLSWPWMVLLRDRNDKRTPRLLSYSSSCSMALMSEFCEKDDICGVFHNQ
jgi:hypothetical protein